jgi:hypothetical protein
LRYETLKAFFRWMEAGREIRSHEEALDRSLLALAGQPTPEDVLA